MGVRSVVASEGSDTTRRILAAASEEFAQRGFASARVRRIVDAAQVNLAAVNYYFGGKEGLCAATLRHLANGRRSAAPHNRRGQSAPERLHRHVCAILARFIGSRRASPLSRILAHEAMNPTAHLEHLIEDMIRPARFGRRTRRVDACRELARHITDFSLAGIAACARAGRIPK
jgi:AcrR family transcriptional regulator